MNGVGVDSVQLMKRWYGRYACHQNGIGNYSVQLMKRWYEANNRGLSRRAAELHHQRKRDQ
jgi:hypothetical protein